MKDAKREELRNKAQEICEILLRAQMSLQIVEFLMACKRAPERKVTKWNAFLIFAEDTNWRMAVIELSMLLRDSSNEKHNLHKFIRLLKADGNFSQAKVPASSIEAWEKVFVDEKEIIDSIIALRDNIYAHKGNLPFPSQLTFAKTLALVKSLKSIMVQFRGIVFEESYLFEVVTEPLDDLKFIIESLMEKDRYLEALENS